MKQYLALNNKKNQTFILASKQLIVCLLNIPLRRLDRRLRIWEQKVRRLLELCLIFSYLLEAFIQTLFRGFFTFSMIFYFFLWKNFIFKKYQKVLHFAILKFKNVNYKQQKVFELAKAGLELQLLVLCRPDQIEPYSWFKLLSAPDHQLNHQLIRFESH